MILASTIQNRLEKFHGSLYPDFDIRFLDKWIRQYPQCFPKFMLLGKYEPRFVWVERLADFRYEIHKI